MHQQGSLDLASTAHEFAAPHTGHREGSTSGLAVMPAQCTWVGAL